MKYNHYSNFCGLLAKLFAACYSGVLCYQLNASLLVWLFWGLFQFSVLGQVFYGVLYANTMKNLVKGVK